MVDTFLGKVLMWLSMLCCGLNMHSSCRILIIIKREFFLQKSPYNSFKASLKYKNWMQLLVKAILIQELVVT